MNNRTLGLVAVMACAVTAVLAGPMPEAQAQAEQRLPYYVVMDPPIVYPGAVVRLQVRAPVGADGGSVFVAGRRFLGRIEEGIFTAYFAVDIDTLPGPYELAYDVGKRRGVRVVTVRARRMDEEGRLTGTLSGEDLAVEDLIRANPRLVSLWNRTTLERYWSGAFLAPVDGTMSATFAMRRTSETTLGRPHTGVDLVSRPGAGVVASSVGVVAVVADAPGGKFVAVDHGYGFFTYYAGLGTALVEEGAWVQRGTPLGNMPATARPTLHFGARLAGAQVDPVSLPGIALKVPEIAGGTKRAPSEERNRQSDYDY